MIQTNSGGNENNIKKTSHAIKFNGNEYDTLRVFSSPNNNRCHIDHAIIGRELSIVVKLHFSGHIMPFIKAS